MSDVVFQSHPAAPTRPSWISAAEQAARRLPRDGAAITLGAVANLVGLAAPAVIVVDGPVWAVLILAAVAAVIGVGAHRLATGS